MLLWVFCFCPHVKWKAPWLVPALICASVTITVCALEWLEESHPNSTHLEGLEWLTYDWRMKMAARHSSSHVVTNLGLITMEDTSIEALLDGSLPYRFGLLWPRQVYARLLAELQAQGAKAVGCPAFGQVRVGGRFMLDRHVLLLHDGHEPHHRS